MTTRSASSTARWTQGINFVDTADVYSAGESEEIVGKALKGRRDDVVLATKFFMPMGDDPNHRGGSRRWIIRAVEDSLRRLGTDYIDLYQVHRPIPDTDVEETLGALTDLVHQGKVRYIGSSSYSGAEIVEAQWTARDRGLERFRTEQPPYSILYAASSSTCCRPRSATAWASSPTARWPAAGCRAAGAPTLARPRRRAGALAARFDMSLPENQRKLDAVEQLAQVADDGGLSLIELAIAFVIRHPAVTSAIIGPRTMEQLERSFPRRTSRSTTPCSTASTRSSNPASTSTPQTPATATTPYGPPPDAAEPEKTSMTTTGAAPTSRSRRRPGPLRPSPYGHGQSSRHRPPQHLAAHRPRSPASCVPATRPTRAACRYEAHPGATLSAPNDRIALISTISSTSSPKPGPAFAQRHTSATVPPAPSLARQGRLFGGQGLQFPRLAPGPRRSRVPPSKPRLWASRPKVAPPRECRPSAEGYLAATRAVEQKESRSWKRGTEVVDLISRGRRARAGFIAADLDGRGCFTRPMPRRG